MMVATAYQLYTLAGVAQLVESILIEQLSFKQWVERSNRFTSTMHHWGSGSLADFHSAGTSSNLV